MKYVPVLLANFSNSVTTLWGLHLLVVMMIRNEETAEKQTATTICKTNQTTTLI